jgi:hypothetical protein
MSKRGQMCKPLLCSSCLHSSAVWTGQSYHNDWMARQLPLKTRSIDFMQTFSKQLCCTKKFIYLYHPKWPYAGL